jgi:alpha-tubulin suppressor-like RCC1 family protein
VIQNDVVVDGPQTVTITASVIGWTSGSNTIVVQDDREDARFAPAIGAGDYHSVALNDDGTAWTWGDNGYGQLGDGTTTTRHAPVQVISLHDVFALAGGGNHTVALAGNGRVWAWGDNSSGQLGDGTFLSRAHPAPVADLTRVWLPPGYSHSLVLKKGRDRVGRETQFRSIGDGMTEIRNIPEPVYT